MQTEPLTLVDAIRHFADPDVTLQTMVGLRWPNGVCCPTCGRTDVRFIPTRRLWECKEKHARRQFSAKVGTIFEDSPISLDKWFVALWMVANCKNGVSSYEVHRALGITQKSAWFMLHRIRLAMQIGSLVRAEGTVEADETFVGGLAKNMHQERRKRTIKGTGGTGKAIVMGILERQGRHESSRVRARVIANCLGETLKGYVRAVVEPGSSLYTDAAAGYGGLGADYRHEVVDHAVEYVRDQVHTNGLENFWSLLKRGLKGTYVSVEPFHLFRSAFGSKHTCRIANGALTMDAASALARIGAWRSDCFRGSSLQGGDRLSRSAHSSVSSTSPTIFPAFPMPWASRRDGWRW